MMIFIFLITITMVYKKFTEKLGPQSQPKDDKEYSKLGNHTVSQLIIETVIQHSSPTAQSNSNQTHQNPNTQKSHQFQIQIFPNPVFIQTPQILNQFEIESKNNNLTHCCQMEILQLLNRTNPAWIAEFPP